MSNSTRERCDFIQCRNCGEIMTGMITQDGSIVPVGVENSGKCGDGAFEVLTAPDAGVPGDSTLDDS